MFLIAEGDILDAPAPAKPKRRNKRPPLRKKRALQTIDALDQRTTGARQARAFVAQVINDLGGVVTETQKVLIERAALLTSMAREAELSWLRREPVNLSEYVSLTQALKRICQVIGVKRVPKEVYAPSLEQYVAEHYPQRQDEDGTAE